MQMRTESPLNFDMYAVDRGGVVLVAESIEKYFGAENYRMFRDAGKKGEYIPGEDRLRVDREMYARLGELFNIPEDQQKRFWKDAMKLGKSTRAYACDVMFPDTDKRVSLVTNIAADNNRPSTALERLTLPKKTISEICKYEQGIVLGFGYLCAELLSRNREDELDDAQNDLTDFLEANLFKGRIADPVDYNVYSYHRQNTNELIRLSEIEEYSKGLLVKRHVIPVRNLRVYAPQFGNVLALYEPRIKHIESAVVKAKERSLQDTKDGFNGGFIETQPYGKDSLGFKLVVMKGGHPMRDLVAQRVEHLLWLYPGFDRVVPIDHVKSSHGNPYRVQFRRNQIYIEGQKIPFEEMVYSLEDHIASEFEVGRFNPELGMHDGPCHNLYKLQIVRNIAQYIWPEALYHIDLAQALKAASYEYVDRAKRQPPEAREESRKPATAKKRA